jgi:hypothetical protein
MNNREVMQMALEALEFADRELIYANEMETGFQTITTAITALRAALETEPSQEPVAWMWDSSYGKQAAAMPVHPPTGAIPIYTAPQRRELSDEPRVNVVNLKGPYGGIEAHGFSEGWPSKKVLTDEEILEIAKKFKNRDQYGNFFDVLAFARAILEASK